MKQLFIGKTPTEADYAEMDPEIVPLVRAFNQFDFMRTFDSCFGHSPREHPEEGNQQPEAFVGVCIMEETGVGTNKAKFMDFFAFVFEGTLAGLGKVFSGTEAEYEGVCFILSEYLYPNLGKSMMRFLITPLKYQRIRSAKLFGIKWLLKRIEQYKKAGGFLRAF